MIEALWISFEMPFSDNGCLVSGSLKCLGYGPLALVKGIPIAHEAIDIHDPKGNKNSSGFLPEEREWMTKFLASGWIDSFRHVHPTTTGAYFLEPGAPQFRPLVPSRAAPGALDGGGFEGPGSRQMDIWPQSLGSAPQVL